MTLVGASAWAVLILFTGTGATSNSLTVLYRGYAVAAPALVGIAWWRRRPDSRTGTLLLLLAICAAVMAWQASAFAYRFSFGVLAEAPYTLLAILLCLTFPTGRLEGLAAKTLAGLTVATLLLTFFPWLISGSVISGSNPVFDCWPGCPPNAFQATTLPDSVRDALAATCYVAISVIGLAVVGLFVSRYRHASRPRRRALGGLGLTSMLVFPVVALFVAGALVFGTIDAERIGLTVSLAVAVIAFPIGFAVPLIAADLAAGNQLQGMLSHLTTRPTRAAWRDLVATVLDDPKLRLGYWDQSAEAYVEPNGRTLSSTRAGADRLWLEIAHDGRPIAAMAVDPELATEPELTEAVAVATVAAATARRLEGTRREVSVRAADAVEAERLRIAREIEAGPQQRLAALRVHIDVLADENAGATSHSFIEEFGRGVDRAIQELGDATRSHVATGVAGRGLGAALRAARADTPVTVRIWDIGLRRHPAPSEMAVYYCALEAIQNTIKHGGSGASVTIRLAERQGGIDFVFEDDGVGFVPVSVAPGSGLTNIRDRIEALGGEVRVDSSVGHGTVIRGSVPDRVGAQ